MNSDWMNSKLMDSDPHERARQMIVLSGPSSPKYVAEADLSRADLSRAEQSRAEQAWLAEHLESCPPCREFADNSREAIRSLRGIAITASGSLVNATQVRVRRRAMELQRQQERLWIVCVCCAAVTLSSALSVAVLWHGFGWIGQQTRLSAPIWEGGFAVFYLMPAVLAGILLLARGTFLADHDGSHLD